MKAWLLVLIAAGGCFTARVSVGPNVASSGRGGVSAAAGYGFGWSWSGQQAVYVTAGGGVVDAGFARALLADSVDYVNYAGRWPVRVSARFGAMFGRDRFHTGDRALLGVGVAWFPWHDRAGSSSGSEREKDVDLLPDMAANRALGVELAIDAMPGTAMTDTAPAERTAAMITLGVVGEFDGMLGH